jgi:ABC-type bacteriocin/lantibiotic exporter with double-glycine peptidase domain
LFFREGLVMQHSETVPATENEAPVGEAQSATEQAPATASTEAPVPAHAEHGHGEEDSAAHGHGHGDDGHHNDHPPPTVRLRKLLSQESAALWVVLVYAAFIGLLALATPVAVQALINQVTFGQLRQPLLVLTVLLFLVLLFSGALRLLQATAVEQLQQRLFVRLGSDLALLLPRVLMAQLRKPPGPRLVSRFFEIITVQKSLANLLLDGMSLLLQSLIGLLVLGFYHPLLLGFDVLLLMAIAVIVLGLGRGAIKSAVAESRAKYDVADWLMELGSHSLTLRGGRGADWAAQRADVLLLQYVQARRLNFSILRRQIIGALLLQAVASSLLLGLGGMLVIWGQLTIGQLVAAELIVSSVVLGVLKFTKHMESYYDLLAGLDKLGYFDDLKDERETGETLTLSERPEVLLRKVKVSDPDSVSELYVDELSISSGSRAAVVGGRGKRLLSEVLYGLLDADHGQVELGGVPIRSLSLSSLRAQVALLHDDREGIVAGSVADNLRFAKESVSFAELRAALQSVSLWNEVSSLPKGLDTQLLSGAPAWSTSMRWRLLIARLLIQKPSLVIVDGEMSLPADLWPLLQSGSWTLLWIGEVGHPMLHHCASLYSVEDDHLRKVDGALHGGEAGGRP